MTLEGEAPDEQENDDDEEDEPLFAEEPDEELLEGKIMAAMTAPPPADIIGLPQGLRVRTAAPARKATLEDGRQAPAAVPAGKAVAGLKGSRWEVWALGIFCLASVLLTGRFFYQWLLPVSPGVEGWRRGCRQCRHEWWEDFWRWRLKGIAAGGSGAGSASGLPHDPPEGMEWEWGSAVNDTDWYGASPELVKSVVSVHAEPSCGPVLHIGCGDSPLPGLLHEAGFKASEHLDVAPEVVQTMRRRYPPEEWPGMHFTVRDFLQSGPPPPAHRFGAVVDKAGIWDWLQEEAPHAVPRLLSNVRKALVEAPGSEHHCGAYIIATKQTPSELSATLQKAAASGGVSGFLVEVTHPLGTKGIAWAYVLVPA